MPTESPKESTESKEKKPNYDLAWLKSLQDEEPEPIEEPINIVMNILDMEKCLKSDKKARYKWERKESVAENNI